jgi:acetate kinase
MGFGALSGLPMATRSGDLPPEGLLYLLRCGRFEPQELEQLLFRQSGLLGLSQHSDDMRELEAQCEQRPRDRFAIEAFVYALRKYVGAYAAVLGGVDALVFSAGIGEHSARVRAELCRDLGWG